MELDPSIPLQAQGINIRPFSQSLGEAMQMQGMQQQNQQNALLIQKQQREQAAQDAFRKAVQETQGDYDAAVDILERQGFGDMALNVRKSLFEQRIQSADLLEKETKTTGERMKQATQLMQGATSPEAYKRIVPRVRALVGPELAAQIPDVFDPAFVESAVQWGMSAAEKAAMRTAATGEFRAGLDAAKDGREAHSFFTGAVAKWLTTASTQEEWTAALAGARQMGASAETLAQFSPEFSPEAVQQASALSMTPEERATLALNKQQAGEQARHNRVMETASMLNAQKAGRGELTPNASLQATRSLRNDFIKETGAAKEVAVQLANMESALQQVKKGSLQAGSQSVITTFNKILDPISAVREGEYARSQQGQSLMARMQGQWQTMTAGGAGIPVPELEKYVVMAREFAQNQRKFADDTARQINGIADEYGLKKDLITADIGGGSTGGETVSKPYIDPSNPLRVITPGGPFTFPNKAQADAYLKRIGGR